MAYRVVGIVLLFCLPLVVTAQYTNVRVSSLLASSPEEVTIAANPTNPLNLVAGSNLRYYYYSTDGGDTWSQDTLPTGTYGDPCVIYDLYGTAYYGHLTDARYFGGQWIDRMTVHRSSNGGVSWYDSTTVGLNYPKQQDKEWLASDMGDTPYSGYIYMAWTEFDSYGSTAPTDSSRILFTRSTDGGTTWSAPLRISDQGGDSYDDDNTVEGAVPAVGPNGEVYTAWAGPTGITFDKSTDGGVTWGNDVFVTSMPGGWAFDVEGIYRVNGLPITACDVSNSPYRGTVYVLWSDQRNGTGNTDVFLKKSTDQGTTWGSTIRVNTDLDSVQQFFPWLTIDQSTGYLYAVYYDRRNYAVGDSLTDVYVSKSTDGGDSWADFKVSQTPFRPSKAKFFGDYINITSLNGKVYPIWMRLDTLSLSVWMTVFDDSPVGVADRRQNEIVSSFSLGQNYPNPFNPSTRIPFSIPERSNVRLTVYDVLGRRVAVLVDGELTAGQHTAVFYSDEVPSGVYFYRLTAGGRDETRRFIVAK